MIFELKKKKKINRRTAISGLEGQMEAICQQSRAIIKRNGNDELKCGIHLGPYPGDLVGE